jgi:N-acetylglucosaminyl-diphospho-decaprenol L-rhamnosyltransferase
MSEPVRGGATKGVDVSVCIANWNCRALLQACLESLLHQPQGVNLEVVVVDNASTDGAPDMVEKLFPEVILRRNTANLGFSRASNQAAALAHGRYLFFLNNDTVVPPNTLRKLLDYATAHPEAGIIGPRLRDGQGDVQISTHPLPTLEALLYRTILGRCTGLGRAAYRRYRRDDFDPEQTHAVEMLLGAAMFMHRAVFEECGRWDEEFVFCAEDLDLSARVGRHRPLIYLADVEITHYGRASSRQHPGYATTNLATGLVRYLRKLGYSRPALWLYKTAVTLDVPVRLLAKSIDYRWRRLRGAPAEKSRLRVQGLRHLLGHLPSLWRQ